ncbi:hypothetical protein [Sporomusa malonica]|uniref:Uncharacterized protein n=1 Tax=Sporomusa malonica TaxID=112901 RepID=A0A1W2DB50_9FIRM|nr:hypothetical protein [Sporomusa malonica]SMC94807.1 hypothetical protein SAMN04488500_114132 [Sporomusa malonica]
MRVRKYQRTAGGHVERSDKVVKNEIETTEQVEERPAPLPAAIPKKQQNSRGPAALFRKVIENPNFNIQLMVIILSLASENFSMDRRIDSMSSTVDKIRNVTDVINSTMQSVKVATDAPKQIRRLFEINKN